MAITPISTRTESVEELAFSAPYFTDTEIWVDWNEVDLAEYVRFFRSEVERHVLAAIDANPAYWTATHPQWGNRWLVAYADVDDENEVDALRTDLRRMVRDAIVAASQPEVVRWLLADAAH